MRTEGRALLWAARHELLTTAQFKKTHALGTDNLSLALACVNGRSGRPNLRPTVHFLCALSLASGSKFYIRWLPSELNPADRGSRRPDSGALPASLFQNRRQVELGGGFESHVEAAVGAPGPACDPCSAGTEAAAADISEGHLSLDSSGVSGAAADQCSTPESARLLPRACDGPSPLVLRARHQAQAERRARRIVDKILPVVGGPRRLASIGIEDTGRPIAFLASAGPFDQACLLAADSFHEGLVQADAAEEPTATALRGTSLHLDRPPGIRSCDGSRWILGLPETSGVDGPATPTPTPPPTPTPTTTTTTPGVT